jgi:ABC-2 type transport system permease protein
VLADTSDPIAPQVLSGLLQKVAMTAMPDVMAQGGIEQIDRWGGGLTPEQKATLQKNVDALRRDTVDGSAAGGAEGGLVSVQVRDVLGEKKKSPGVAVLAAGLGVMFLLFSAAGAGGALIEEVESGTLDRILSTRVTMTQLLSGKLLYLSTVAVAQLTVMFVWGELFFGLELHRHVPGFVLMTIVTALAASAFGLVLAAICRTRMQLVALSNMVILVMSALGGSMFPRYLLSESVQKIGLVTLNAWAIDGFMKVFWREEPLTALTPQVAFLVAAALVLFGFARRLARRWEVA